MGKVFGNNDDDDAPTPAVCKHEPLPGLDGKIISPRVHYGDGAEGMVECLRCGKFFANITKGQLKAF